MLERLAAIPGVEVRENVPLKTVTRFAVGGPAGVLADVSAEPALVQAIDAIRSAGARWALIGGGTNLVAGDEGFDGVVLRYVANRVEVSSSEIAVEAGAVLQDLVDASIAHGRRGLETMTGIPGWTGGAIYGNAGAYGHSIQEIIASVRYFNGRIFSEMSGAQCQFRYRESIFKRQKDWIVTAATMILGPGDPVEVKATADGILKIRNEKYPPSMRCAGSIFKNLILAELPEQVRRMVPERVIREGKVPSAYFLEQAGAKGLRNGAIHVADYHANLIYNADGGTARQVREVIDGLKQRVRECYGLELEEEVQYL